VTVTNPQRVAYLTQTTLSVDDANRVIEALRRRFPAIVGPPKEDICYATQNRQEALKALLPMADAVLVIGSRNSSNSTRLAEIAAEYTGRAHLIDGVDEIDPAWFARQDTVLITAGASAPENLVQECVAYLRQNFQAEVEHHTIREENVEFLLPLEVR
jgi:4-hydroxy-3-methylbut-2-enyl diphosphate reductase